MITDIFRIIKRRTEYLKEMLEDTGIFVIVTSKEMGANEALETYRDRDAVEKVFRMEKSYLGNGVFRVHTGEHLESKTFISFIALIIRNEIYKSMKKLYLHDKMNDLFRTYMIVGGMPEVVKTYTETKSFYETLKIQRAIVDDYIKDMVKYADSTDAMKIRECFSSILL